MISQTRWRKSSRSGANANGCVELAHTFEAIRDSKNATGPTLRGDLASLLVSVKAGHLHR
jgi:hypothetical protein